LRISNRHATRRVERQ